jgi:hypothetical protein
VDNTATLRARIIEAIRSNGEKNVDPYIGSTGPLSSCDQRHYQFYMR